MWSGSLPCVTASAVSCVMVKQEGRLTNKIEQLKSQIRAKVEHPFYWLKVHFGHRKVRYCGLAKNTAQLYSLFALANLFLSRQCMPLAG